MGLSIIVIGYFLVSIYLSRELAAILMINSLKYKLLYYITYFTIAMSYILSRMLSTYSPNDFTDFIALLGGHAIPTTFYATIIIVMYKILQLVYIKSTGNECLLQARTGFCLLAIILLLINIYGVHNGTNHVIRTYDVAVNKNIPDTKIVMVSDLHFGKTTSREYAQKLVGNINAQQADIVFLLGDIVDSDLESVVRKDLLAPLKNIKSKDGVYAVLGNHEYISKQPLEVIRLLQANNVTTLVDQHKPIDGRNLSIVGLNDIGRRSPDDKDKKTMQMLLKDTTATDAVILLDHQPKRIALANQVGIDMALSGHTHLGQYWPNNYVTKSIFLNDWGLKKFDNMYSIVSCGYGNWGANMRIGSRVELVVINLKGQQ